MPLQNHKSQRGGRTWNTRSTRIVSHTSAASATLTHASAAMKRSSASLFCTAATCRSNRLMGDLPDLSLSELYVTSEALQHEFAAAVEDARWTRRTISMDARPVARFRVRITSERGGSFRTR